MTSLMLAFQLATLAHDHADFCKAACVQQYGAGAKTRLVIVRCERGGSEADALAT